MTLMTQLMRFDKISSQGRVKFQVEDIPFWNNIIDIVRKFNV